jgi:hypothetical protein
MIFFNYYINYFSEFIMILSCTKDEYYFDDIINIISSKFYRLSYPKLKIYLPPKFFDLIFV